jgi:glutathione synthase/RimK-type ligase-like ATP-grasp enzyme
VPDVALLTDARYEQPAPSQVTPYVRNILDEDALVLDALARRGLEAVRVDWARPGFDWSSVRAAVFRTTWDYFVRPVEFSRWLDEAALRTQLVNVPELVRWNLDKRYLLDLGRSGVAVPPTEVLAPGEPGALERALDRLGGDEIVVKPTVSGAARHTHRLTRAQAAAPPGWLTELLAAETMLAQPFLPRVLHEGEVTLVVIEGRITHAVRKRARPGDFRVQDDHGGTVHPHEPERDEIELAVRAVDACGQVPAYARVDLVRDDQGRPVLMELELIEPELFFRCCPAAADAFAGAIAGTVSRSQETAGGKMAWRSERSSLTS